MLNVATLLYHYDQYYPKIPGRVERSVYYRIGVLIALIKDEINDLLAAPFSPQSVNSRGDMELEPLPSARMEVLERTHKTHSRAFIFNRVVPEPILFKAWADIFVPEPTCIASRRCAHVRDFLARS